MNKKYKLLLLCAGIVLSCTLLYSLSVSPSITSHTLASISAKKETVLKLTAAITGVVVLLSLVPGDITKNICAAFTNLTGWLLIITAALFLEKYLVTLTGLIAFRFLIPVGLLFLLYDTYKEEIRFHRIAKRLIAFGLCLYALVPATMFVADLFENTYDQSVEAALRAQEDIAEAAAEETPAPTATPEAEEEKGPLSILNNVWNSISTTTSDLIETVKELPSSAQNALDEASRKFDLFVESIAIMLITTCVLPILVLFLFSWMMKLFFNVQIPMPTKAPRLADKVQQIKQRNKEQKQIEHKEDVL